MTKKFLHSEAYDDLIIQNHNPGIKMPPFFSNIDKYFLQTHNENIEHSY